VVRKQLYIDDRQERALKRKAKALGISEAELVRQALDRALEDRTRVRPGRLQALAAFLERAAKSAASGHRLARRVRREELYEEREARLARR
jgi:hypothetical protein